MKVVLLAAGIGKRFGRKTKALPKCLIPLGPSGQTLLRRYFDSFRTLGLKKIVIVVGHEKEKIKAACRRFAPDLKIKFISNPRYRRGSVYSLFKAVEEFDDDLVIMDADVYFPTDALKKLIRSKQKTAFLADTRSKSSGEEMMLMAKNGRLVRIAKKTDPSLKILGEATGFFKISKAHAGILKNILRDFVRRGDIDAEYEDSYNALMQKVKVGMEKIGGCFWTEMDFEEDWKKITDSPHH